MSATSPRLTRHLALVLVLGLLGLLVAASSASAQAPTRPSKAQAFTIAGDVAAAWADVLDAADVEIETCGARGTSVRRCVIHVYDESSSDSFDCHWRVISQVLSTGMLSWWTTRQRSLDDHCPATLPAGPPSSGQAPIAAAGRLAGL